MNRFAWIAFATTVVVPMCSATATDPYPIDPVSEIPSRWADAARGLKSLHADIVRYEYDHIFRVHSKSEGTIDFERPNRCRLELQAVDASSLKPIRLGDFEYAPKRKDPLTIVWTGEGMTFDAIPLKNGGSLLVIGHASISEEMPDQNTTIASNEEWFATLRSMYAGDQFWELLTDLVRPTNADAAINQHASGLWLYPSPFEALPALLSGPNSLEELGFRLSYYKTVLTAAPVSVTSKELQGVERIDVRFDSSTGLPCATRVIRNSNTQVYVLKNVQLNEPACRSDLFNPKPEELLKAQ